MLRKETLKNGPEHKRTQLTGLTSLRDGQVCTRRSQIDSSNYQNPTAAECLIGQSQTTLGAGHHTFLFDFARTRSEGKRQRERERERERERQRERDREKSRERERESQRETEKERLRETDRNLEESESEREGKRSG